MTRNGVYLLLGFIGLQSLVNGLDLSKNSMKAPIGLSPAPLHGSHHPIKSQDSSSAWVITSLYYSSTCSTTAGSAPFVDGAQTNACLVSAAEPESSYVYTCNSDSTYSVSTYSGSDCAGTPLSTHTQGFSCTPYTANNTLLASYAVQCASANPVSLSADYIVTSSSWTASCSGAYDFSSILNRACASYMNASSTDDDAVYSVYYDYPYTYLYPTSTNCAGNYTSASDIGGSTCSATGSAGYNTLYGMRQLEDSVTAAGVRPTQVPSAAPTVSPSFSPTELPSITPTLHPTLHPSIIPTYHPTPPTHKPTVIPSGHPTNPPSPTVKPTPFPTGVVTVEPTGGQYVITITFTCIQIVVDVDISGYDFEIDINIYVWRVTIAKAAGCSTDDVTVDSMTTSSDSKLQGTQGTVTYTIAMDVAAEGYSSPEEAYTTVTGNLNSALADGSFTSILQSTAVEYGATDLAYASSDSATFSEPTVVATPVSDSSSSQEMSSGAMAGIIIGGVVAVGLAVAWIVWKFCKKTSALPPQEDVEMPAIKDAAAGGVGAAAAAAGETVNPMTA